MKILICMYVITETPFAKLISMVDSIANKRNVGARDFVRPGPAPIIIDTRGPCLFVYKQPEAGGWAEVYQRLLDGDLRETCGFSSLVAEHECV